MVQHLLAAVLFHLDLGYYQHTIWNKILPKSQYIKNINKSYNILTSKFQIQLHLFLQWELWLNILCKATIPF